MTSKNKTIRKRITDLFKSIFSGRKSRVSTPHDLRETEEPVKKPSWFQPRKSPHGRWIITHNRIQRTRTKKIRKRRAKNKVAKQSRKINHRKAA